MSAATWSNARVHQCYPDASPACTRCGAAYDTDIHTFWQCPANVNIDSDAIRNTQSLCDVAAERAAEYPCLWLRGLLPAHLVNIQHTFNPSEEISLVYENAPACNFHDGVYYGDASGGSFTAFPSIRRCGCGLAQVDAQGVFIWGARFNLPGSVQTVPRAELFVLAMLLDRSQASSTIAFITDNQKNSELFNKGEAATLKSANCDLFRDIFEAIRIKCLQVTVSWMPSHLTDDDPLPEGITRRDLLGNRQADRLAGDAARSVELPPAVTTPVLYYHGLVRRIQRRLIDILINLPSRQKVSKDIKHISLKPKIVDLLPVTSHLAFVSKDRVCCARCHENYLQKDPAVFHWLESTCRGIGLSQDRPMPLPFDARHVGNSTTHYTHKLWIYKGLCYCRRCGAYGSKKLGKLAKPCLPPTYAGQQVLKAIFTGRLPQGLASWPAHTFPVHSSSILTPEEQAQLAVLYQTFNSTWCTRHSADIDMPPISEV